MAHKYNAIFVKLLIISRKQYIQMAHKWLLLKQAINFGLSRFKSPTNSWRFTAPG